MTFDNDNELIEFMTIMKRQAIDILLNAMLKDVTLDNKENQINFEKGYNNLFGLKKK